MEATTDAPTPNINPMPVVIINSGAVMLTAASASLPTPLPTNIPSVITNIAEKTIPNTVGINNWKYSSLRSQYYLSFPYFLSFSCCKDTAGNTGKNYQLVINNMSIK
jgi:hypothetical protein